MPNPNRRFIDIDRCDSPCGPLITADSMPPAGCPGEKNSPPDARTTAERFERQVQDRAESDREAGEQCHIERGIRGEQPLDDSGVRLESTGDQGQQQNQRGKRAKDGEPCAHPESTARERERAERCSLGFRRRAPQRASGHADPAFAGRQDRAGSQ